MTEPLDPACSGKVTHRTRADARKAIESVRRRHQYQARACSSQTGKIYKCERCHHWHIGG